MDPTLFASYRDPDAAERAFNALLDAGVQPEDLSLLVNNFAEGGPTTSSDLTGTYDPAVGSALVDMTVGEAHIETEGSFVHESQIGGGINTSTREDSVSGVEEMDDGQAVAEDMIYP